MAIDYARLARDGASPEQLAEAFISDYYSGQKPSIPVNPFEILRDMGIVFSFRNFSNYEGIYIPAEGDDDVPVVGINANRPVTRQRYTASHELCHRDSMSPAVPKNLTALPALTAAAPAAIARWALPRPVRPWNARSWACSMRSSDARSSLP